MENPSNESPLVGGGGNRESYGGCNGPGSAYPIATDWTVPSQLRALV